MNIRLLVHDPATGDRIAEVHTASEADIAQAVEAAHRRFCDGDWSRSPRQHRADVLDRAAALLGRHLNHLITLEVRQTGRAVREMRAQVPTLVRWFRYYAALLRTETRAVLPTAGALHNWADRVPLGVVALVTPFNHPLLIAVKKLAPALAAGNSVVLKPSEQTPVTSLLLGPILAEAGVPEGVFSVLPGLGATAGRALVGHELVRKVDVTGGTAAGRAIGAVVGGNLARYTAELGGKAPLIVLEKASVDAAVNGIAFGAFIASGQTCVAATRILVHNSVIDEVRRKIKAKAESIQERMGSPANPESTMGPVISSKQLHNIESLVGDALADGADLVHGGERMSGTSPLDGTDFSKGHFYPPTILDLGSIAHPRAPIWEEDTSNGGPVIATRLWREEAFGPVVVLVGFDTEAQAVALANDTPYGLGAALWTTELSQAFRVSEQIRAGIVWVNTHHRNDPSSPWGGLTAASGVGSENGVEAYHAYTMTRSTIINYASTEESIAQGDWFRVGAGQVRYG
ncbi:betaine aldehyde dehydrogenase [Cordyceps fumosorosea ARSEF 2679]|uniref:aldehyde dehydrogenase (NAD(+)) n=1 Tax=Cordyceps fumosorosea (strain ARSEF 2679) TaxID=1081104 RepID=A0A168DGM7_CORFA|nr:betaine aldehyde dehydrogenase [Cordyceps fumosorosea ARSEF 2679]OAA72593.1 betaine aldehyde dehydrogenase [Cordyceps fumosorosea ARSEF 2679]